MGELTKKHRPATFDKVVGQVSAVRLLRAAARNPLKSANSLILFGPWGTGKTTLARIFGGALACERFSETGQVCGRCEGCKQYKGGVTNRYTEYDSSMVGKVSQIRDLRPVFEMSTSYPRVIVLDEAHLISRDAQSALLKTIEEGPRNTFFVFCSTDPKYILNTIHSRSLPVELFKVDHDLIVEHLKDVYGIETGLSDIEPEVLDKIAFKCDGHVRDALMLLEGYMMDKDASLLEVPIDSIVDFFVYLAKGDVQTAVGVASKDVMKFPLHLIQRSLHYVILQLVAASALGTQNKYGVIARAIGNQKMTELFKDISDNWAQGVFADKYLTMSFFITLARSYTK